MVLIPRPSHDDRNDDRVNEYKTDNVSTLAFPTLYPWGEPCLFDDIPNIDKKD